MAPGQLEEGARRILKTGRPFVTGNAKHVPVWLRQYESTNEEHGFRMSLQLFDSSAKKVRKQQIVVAHDVEIRSFYVCNSIAEVCHHAETFGVAKVMDSRISTRNGLHDGSSIIV
jgi:hypothetical protein